MRVDSSKLAALFCFGAALGVAVTASAVPTVGSPHTAQVTDVADAAEPENPFDFNASVGFRRVLRRSRITREYVDGGRATFADELSYSQVQQILDIRAQVSLFHDLELNFFLPYTFNVNTAYQYTDGLTAANSTVTNDPNFGGALFNVPYETRRGGLTSMDLGLAWSPFNDQRDDTKATWTIRATYSIPIGAAFRPVRSADRIEDANLVNDPANGNLLDSPAAAGDKVHRVRLETGFSKRFSVFDPYVMFNYVQPIADASGMARHTPPITGGFITGFEVVPWDSPSERQRFSLDLRIGAQFTGSGRTYSELTDALRQLTFVDNYATFTGGVHMVFQPIQYLRLSAGVSLGHDTQHLVTNENPGTPGADGVVDLNDPAEANPDYRNEIDLPGRRFRVEDTTIFTWYVGLQLLL